MGCIQHQQKVPFTILVILLAKQVKFLIVHLIQLNCYLF
uniref:Uncharacterized protein n=1 Tax=Anguilla anguilla TaxID=7936 RepID=A0A0E9UER1_ANGAN